MLSGKKVIVDSEKTKLSATLYNSVYKTGPFVWSSSDETVATVDENGVVTPLKVGVVTITVATKYTTQYSTSIELTIKPSEVTTDAGLKMQLVDTGEGDYNLILTGVVGDDIQNVVIPSSVEIDGVKYSVTEIGEGAFKDNTEIKSVTIPESVTAIGDEAFSGCTELEILISLPTVPPTIGKDAFDDTHLSASEVRVPDLNVDDYTDHEDWGNFAQIWGVSHVKATALVISHDNAQLEVGKNLTLAVTFEPTNATLKDVEWTSSDEAVAKVSATGEVTAVAAGKVTITATAKDGSGLKAECEVEVIVPTGITAVGSDEQPAYRVEGDALIIDSDDESLTVTVYSIAGSRVYQGRSKRIEGLAQGVYIVRFVTHSFKIIIK